MPGGIAALAPYEEVIDQTAQKKDLRGMRMIKSELKNWLRDMGPVHLGRLDAELAKSGIDASNTAAELDSEVAQILARGVIRDDDEYQALFSWMDNAQHDRDADNMQLADGLLTAFATKIR